MSLTENRKSSRRFLLPLGLSLGLHGLLIACVTLIPSSRQADAPPAGPTSPPLLLTVSWDEGKPKSRPGRDPGDELPDDLNPIIESQTRSSSMPVSVASGMRGGADTSRGGGEDGGPAASATASLLAAPEKARRIAYVIDRSISMGDSGALRRAREEIVASLRTLSPQARFQVIVYNRFAQPLLSADWLTPDEATLAAIERRLDEVTAAGSTDHVRALRQALVARPDLLFWVTDADDLNEAAVNEVTRLNNGGASIHVVELAAGRDDPNSLLARLASNNKGKHRRIAPEWRR